MGRGGGGGEERAQPLQDSCPKNLGESEAALGATIQRRGAGPPSRENFIAISIIKKKKSNKNTKKIITNNNDP